MKKILLFIPGILLSAVIYGQEIKNDSSAKATLKENFRDDWADLRHYAKENKTLTPPASGENRVVFLGSSIFEFWKTRAPKYFEDHKNYIDRGISGQIAPQLLIRFQQDVVELKPKAVIILAGSNDLKASTGHVTYETIMNNIKSMVEIAKAHHLKVILCEYLPINEIPDKIVAMNKIIKKYAEENDLTVLDYFTPLTDGHDMQKAEQTIDGTHPKPAGYEIMAKVTEVAINKALNKK